MKYQLTPSSIITKIGKEYLLKVEDSVLKINDDAKAILETIKEPKTISEIKAILDEEHNLLIDEDSLTQFMKSQQSLGVVESL
ncbi:hypothetical protein [Vibrio porteresiae]|uniref:PqqD family protein n=1 Tax=Vibrio porteresiae DSM 19223 TaxID=1123496 RepID=A0ABZ0QJ73_9VIBR|nr:hypothetical protein [Vibrio porteresiae]WPC75481.1 hypothetical protein R8Z52_21365 [Vibrio porteresiae DSM 19223]